MSTAAGRGWRGYLYVAPAAVYLALFSIFPILYAGYMALHRWHLLKGRPVFVGLDNFLALARDPFFRNAVWNTLTFVSFSVPLGVATALAVALLVARPLRGVALFRTLYYIPAVSSQVALSMLWTWVLLPESGLINSVLAWLGTAVSDARVALGLLPLAGETLARLGLAGDVDFLQRPGWAMAALVSMFLWIGLGPRMVIFLAGIQAIPAALYEAAALDGCSTWQRFRHVTLPLLLPTTLFVVVTTTIAAFQVFTPVYVMTRGGPRRSTDVVLYHIYNEAWQKFEVGMASAMSYVLFAMILLVSAVQFRVLRRGLSEAATA